MKTFNTLFAIATLTASSAAFADEGISFSDLDTDKNGFISVQEASVSPALAEKFNELDTDHDGQLSEAEFSQA